MLRGHLLQGLGYQPRSWRSPAQYGPRACRCLDPRPGARKRRRSGDPAGARTVHILMRPKHRVIHAESSRHPFAGVSQVAIPQACMCPLPSRPPGEPGSTPTDTGVKRTNAEKRNGALGPWTHTHTHLPSRSIRLASQNARRPHLLAENVSVLQHRPSGKQAQPTFRVAPPARHPPESPSPHWAFNNPASPANNRSIQGGG